MNEWFTEFVQTNLAPQQPPPPPFPQPIPMTPQVLELVHLSKPPVDKIRKYGAKEFRATVDDDLRGPSSGHSSQDRGVRYSRLKPQATSITSMGSARNARPECKHCNRPHYGECWVKSGACFRCGSFDHYLRDCPEKSANEKAQTARSSNTATRGRPPRNTKNMNGSQGATRDSIVRSEARAVARAYAIRAHEDVSAPDVITGIYSLYNTDTKYY
ncbi:uncharacterized protein [Gossypium hirsutum]|uniref:CCHC-type domain-containing protein n=1 Tax=Gossypium hirsutum TaxID=3635 RepID=A0ABM2ZBP9_GOSHI|nr:uncharacterized protein LOC121211406 [Gossypium hirsutum]